MIFDIYLLMTDMSDDEKRKLHFSYYKSKYMQELVYHIAEHFNVCLKSAYVIERQSSYIWQKSQHEQATTRYTSWLFRELSNLQNYCCMFAWC